MPLRLLLFLLVLVLLLLLLLLLMLLLSECEPGGGCNVILMSNLNTVNGQVELMLK